MASTMRWRWSPLVSDLGRGTSNRRTTNAATAVRRSRTAVERAPVGHVERRPRGPGTGVGAPSSMSTSAASSASTSPRPGRNVSSRLVDRRAGGRDRGRRPDGVAAVVGGWCAAACALRHRVRPAGRGAGAAASPDGAEHERLGLRDRAVALGAVGGDAAAGQARVDQRHRDVEVLRRERAGLDARGEDPAQDLLDHHDVLADALLGPAREHRPQLRAGGQVVHLRQRGLLADVRLQLLGRVLDVVQRALQRRRVLLGLVRDEPEQEGLLVGEVVVDGGASDAGGGRDLGERDRVEPLVGHERREGREELLAGLLAVLVQGPADDLGHRDIIARSVIKWVRRRRLPVRRPMNRYKWVISA